MPAETHQHHPDDGAEQLLELITMLVAPTGRPMDLDDALAGHGLDDEPVQWALWDAVAEEFGERSVAEAGDADDLDDVETVGELVDVFAGWLGWRTRPTTPEPATHG